MNNFDVNGQGCVNAASMLLDSRLSPGQPFRNDNGMQQACESILQEAHRLTHGPRQQDYGHPLDDYNRTAALVSAMLSHKLKEPLTAHEMALAMVCVKLSRQVTRPKRDNMVDGAGYCWVADEILEETARRAGANRVR